MTKPLNKQEINKIPTIRFRKTSKNEKTKNNSVMQI